MTDWFDWVQDDKLRAAFDLLINGGKISQPDAVDVVQRLVKEGEVHTRRLVGDDFYDAYFPTDRHGTTWKSGQPTGVVDHYTAATSARGTLRWFSRQPRGAVGNSSAHVVMSRRGVIIPVVDPLTLVAWHAGGVNSTHIGIEHVNAGLLCKSGAKFLFMGQYPYPEDRLPFIQEINENYWEPYLTAQLVSNIALKRLLCLAIPTLQQERFVDHAMVAPARKIDCGPLWPLKKLNALVFSWRAIRGLQSLETTVMTKDAVESFNNEVSVMLL